MAATVAAVHPEQQDRQSEESDCQRLILLRPDQVVTSFLARACAVTSVQRGTAGSTLAHVLPSCTQHTVATFSQPWCAQEQGAGQSLQVRLRLEGRRCQLAGLLAGGERLLLTHVHLVKEGTSGVALQVLLCACSLPCAAQPASSVLMRRIALPSQPLLSARNARTAASKDMHRGQSSSDTRARS